MANLLAVWRTHGVDEVMREAWEAGIVLAGVSAGSICWHVGGPTDSFGPTLRPVTNGLGLLPYGNGVHYDSEQQRRPLLHQLVADGVLPRSYATDDRTGILYEGVEPVAVVTDDMGSVDDVAAADPAGPSAYLVERSDTGDVTETRLPPGPVGAGLGCAHDRTAARRHLVPRPPRDLHRPGRRDGRRHRQGRPPPPVSVTTDRVAAERRAASSTSIAATASRGSTGTGPPSRTAASTAG